MNKFTLVLGLLLASVFFVKSSNWSQSRSGGAPAAQTGAPKATSGNETTCISCHGGSLNTGSRSVAIDFDGDPQSLVPGEQYSVTVSIPGSTASNAGFQIVSLTQARANCGGFTVGATSKLAISSGRTYVTHNNPNNTSWTFTWTAPATLPDSVFFYASAREISGGTQTYTSKKKFINNLTSTKAEFSNNSFSLYPTQTDGRIYLKMNSLNSPFTTIQIIDTKGRLVCSKELLSMQQDNLGSFEIDLPTESKSGWYFCQLVSGDQRFVKKFFKN